MVRKKILVVGGAGYIGGYTTDYLNRMNSIPGYDYDVVVFDNLVYETRYLKPVQFIYGDIRNTQSVLEVAKDCDVVILMAALVGDPACAVDVNLTDEINHIAVKNICEQLDPEKHVIFMSTCSVYGAQLDILNEESPTIPLSAYASTKILAEKYVTERNGTIFRLGTVYGLGDPFSRIRLDLVVNVLAMKAVYEKKIHIFGGEQWRPLICVKDVAGYIEEAIAENIRGTYILSERNYTMKDLGILIKVIIPDIDLQFTDISFEDARNYKVDSIKTEQTFKYKPQYDIPSEVKKMKKIFEEHRICDITEDAYHNGNFIKNNWIKKNMLGL
jgi:nucleoside-diphosphate-sugar epimerase